MEGMLHLCLSFHGEFVYCFTISNNLYTCLEKPSGNQVSGNVEMITTSAKSILSENSVENTVHFLKKKKKKF